MPYIYPPPSQGYPTSRNGRDLKQGRADVGGSFDMQYAYGHGTASTRTSLDSRDERMKWESGDDLESQNFDRPEHMPFSGVWDPLFALDPRTLPPPATWSDDEDVIVHQPSKKPIETARPAQQLMPSYHAQDVHAHYQYDVRSYASHQAYPVMDSYPPVESYVEPAYPFAPTFAWSPSCAAPGVHPMDYGAPVLHPRLVQMPETLITPHDTYRYPTSHAEHMYVAPTADGPGKDAVNSAFSRWYAEQIVDLLVKPGQFRPGVGGSSEENWGIGGREKDAWIRIGRTPPDYSKSWGRMGMTSTPAPIHRQLQQRKPLREVRDPYNICWKHEPAIAPALVAFIQDMIQRMTISPTAVIAAVWFVTGLGLHEGDREKGVGLRKALEEFYWTDSENLAVEKRLAMLGLLLAGKWLDDNSFLTKSWFEVTAIPIAQIDRLERAALHDFHYSLYIPVTSWVDHVNQAWSSLVAKGDALDDMESVVLAIVDGMVTEARDVEVNDPKSAASSFAEQAYSTPDIRAAADQAISRDWGTFVRPYIHDSNETGSSYGSARGQQRPQTVQPLPEDSEMILTRKNLTELADDEVEDEEEFLDYDGATRWLPSVSELRRSSSNSSVDAVETWRASVKLAPQYAATPTRSVVAFEPQPFDARRGGCHSVQDYDSRVHSSSGPCPQCRCDHPQQRIAKGPAYNETGVFLEPGISVIRPASSWSRIDHNEQAFGTGNIAHLKLNTYVQGSKGFSRYHSPPYSSDRSAIDQSGLHHFRPALATQY